MHTYINIIQGLRILQILLKILHLRQQEQLLTLKVLVHFPILIKYVYYYLFSGGYHNILRT